MTGTLIDLLERAVERFGDQPALSMRGEDGQLQAWSYRELDRRSKIAAWRLRNLGLEPGDRILTWSPSTPALPATYFGAMRARLILVPLDLRMSPDAIKGIAEASGARHLVIGTGRDAPDPRDANLESMPTTTVEALTAEPEAANGGIDGGGGIDAGLPHDWQTQVAKWDRPAPEEVWELIFTSGTTGSPKGVMLAHDSIRAGIESFHGILPPREHRIVSLLPLSHLFEQAVGLLYALDVGADVRYVRSRNPRVIFDALREHRVTSMIVVPQVLDLFWSAIEREVEKQGRTVAFGRLRAIARRLPIGWRRRLFGRIHGQLGGDFRLFISSGAFLPPSLQQAWEDLGVTVLQGYGSTESSSGTCTTLRDHGLGTVGWPAPGIEMRLAEDGEVQFRGPSVFKGYWQDPQRTREAFTDDGWYRTGDVGHLDPDGRLVLSGRKRDVIVLPNGFNVFPEDIENALRIAGIRDSVVVETRPGRIEVVLLAPGVHGLPGGPGAHEAAALSDDPELLRERVNAAVREANASLGPNQRIAGWRLWPDDDFPRTHTLKVKREPVRAWAVVEAPLPVRDGAGAGGAGGAGAGTG